MFVGLDRLPSLPTLIARLRSARVGLLAHPPSVDKAFRHASDVLLAEGIKPTLFLGPEHGYGGEAQDMIGVADARDARTGAPIVSLYGDRFEDLSPTPDHLAKIDVLVIDLADVGSRYYTFIWTALLAVRAAAKAGVHCVILDRPNPLGTRLVDVEGKLPEPGFLSFVGLEPIPVRHGLTVGQIVRLFATRDGLREGDDEAFSVVEVLDGPGDHGAELWDRPFVQTSPNMPTLETARVYPGGCLLEGTNLSDGRGLTRPFEITGAPFIDGRALAEGLARTDLPGFIARPLTFHAMFHKHARTISGGVQIHITDVNAFRPYATYLALIAIAHHQSPDQFRFRTERYEFVDDIPAFDLLTGSSSAREAILRGEDPAEIAHREATRPAGWEIPERR